MSNSTNNSFSMINWRNILTLVGFSIVIIALFSDVILSGTNSGIGPLQIIVAIFGLLIAGFSRLTFSGLERGGIVLFSVLVMIIILEFVLMALGFPVEYVAPPDDMVDIESVTFDDIRICDERIGCHYNAERVRGNCADTSLCSVNSDGFINPEDFTAENVADASYKILVLGDSFTWGYSAPYGEGWVDLMRNELQIDDETIEVWNAAYAGTGTHQALITANYLLPIMQPDLVILGFHTGNDLADNMYPYDRFINVNVEGGNSVLTQQYTLTDSGVIRETPQVLYYRALGYTVSSNTFGAVQQIENLLTRTRLGTLAVGAIRTLGPGRTQLNNSIEPVSELQTLVTGYGSRFMVVIIPEQGDTIRPGAKYLDGLRVMEQATVPYIDTLHLLSFDDFENRQSTNKHWNAQGQAKAAEFIITCVRHIIMSDEFCPAIISTDS